MTSHATKHRALDINPGPKEKRRRLLAASIGLYFRVLAKFAPPENILTSEWAEKYRILSPEASAEHGKWKNHRTPHLIEPMDVVHDKRVEETFLMFSAQMGKSEVLNNIQGCRIHLRPGPMMMLQPTVQMAEDYSKDRIGPMIRDCRPLAELVGVDKKDGNTALHKTFPGGHLTLTGSNSPAALASRPIRDIIADEVDRCAVTNEGDSIALAEQRTITFWDSIKYKVSTPVYKNTSRIEKGWNRSDKRRRFVKCPKCQHDQTLIWDNVKWEKKVIDGVKRHLPNTAYYQCEKCKHEIRDGERYRILREGYWKATAPFTGVAGFHINQLYSMFRKLSEIVKDFLKWKDNPETLQIFVNTVLGLPFEIKGVTPEWRRLYERRETYEIGTIPKGGVFLTCGVDIQGDRIHGEVVAWGRNFETWSVNHFVLHGETHKPNSKVWRELDKEIQKTYPNYKGVQVGISQTCIDANYLTRVVHNWARKYPGSRVRCIVGRDNQRVVVGTPGRVDLKKDKKYGLKSYPVGVSLCKEELYAFLRQDKPTERGEYYPLGYCHFPQYDADFFKELCAESQVRETNKRGYTLYRWVKTQDRNEALDTRIYARAAAYLVGIDRFSEADWLEEEKRLPGGVVTKDCLPVKTYKQKSNTYWSN